MSEASSNEQVREDIARALRGLDRDRLLELVSDLVNIYVIEGSAPWAVAEPGADPFDGGRPPSFARLMTDLKARLALPELECFRVEGGSDLAYKQSYTRQVRETYWYCPKVGSFAKMLREVAVTSRDSPSSRESTEIVLVSYARKG